MEPRNREKDRVNWHIGIPVCGTIRGARTHLSLFAMDDLQLICRHLNCSASEADKKLAKAAQKREFV